MPSNYERPEGVFSADAHAAIQREQLASDQIYQIRRVIVQRWARAIVGHMSVVAAMAGFVWLPIALSRASVPLNVVVFLIVLYLCIILVYVLHVSQRLRNLRSLARTPMQTVDGPILVSEHGVWFRDGEIFTWVNPYDHWMHLLPPFRGTLDSAYRYRLSYVKLLRPPCQYFIVGAEVLGIVSQEEIATLNEFLEKITPVFDVSGD